jgi:hypothetical protein
MYQSIVEELWMDGAGFVEVVIEIYLRGDL